MVERTTSPAQVLFLALAASIHLNACGDDKPEAVADAGVQDGGPTKPVLGGRLGEAVAAAASASSRPDAAPADSGGPPESGFFPPGRADAAHRPDAPPKVDLFNEGSDPKVQLAYAPPGGEQKAIVGVGLRLQAQMALPNIDFTLSAKIDKGDKDEKKEKGKKGEKAADKPAEAEKPEGSPKRVRVVIASADAGKEAAGKKGFAEAVSKLKGSEFRYELGKDGTIREMAVMLAKDADPQLESVMRGLADVLTISTVPLPAKPVGVGAQWMATDRSSSFGVDVVRYRAFKVEKIEDGAVSLSVDVRQYSAKQEVNLGAASGNKPLSIERFDSQGKGSQVLAGSILPKTIELQHRLQARVTTQTEQGQPAQGVLYLQVSAKTQ